MENNQEYYCTKCNSQVGENDTVCKNCGADLTEIVEETGWLRFKQKILSFINRFGKRHRISYYLFLGPLLMLVTSILLGILGIAYYELLRDTVERLGISYAFDYFSYILITIPYILPVFVFTHLYLKGELKIKIIITVSIIIILFLSSISLQYFGFNTLGIILLSIILMEISFIKYSNKKYLILIVMIILFLGWFEFLSLGDLQREIVREDYKKITEPLKVIKSEVNMISFPDDFDTYDEVVPFIIFREKDTLQLTLKYNKTWDTSIPSQKWKLIDWTIDSVFANVYYMPKEI